MEMRQKRPRLPINKNLNENRENADIEEDTTVSIGANEIASWSRREMPDMEFDEIRHKELYEPKGMADYQIIKETDQKEVKDDSLDDTSNTDVLSNIYNSIMLEDSL